MQTKFLDYSDNSTTLKGYLAYDDSFSESRPAVLVIHDWSGLNDHAKERAEWLAQMGYIGFALDMYGEGKIGQNNEEKLALMTPFIKDRNLVVSRIKAAIEIIKSQKVVNSNSLAIIGFCFGGLCALDAARRGLSVKAAVSFHGNLSKPNFQSVPVISAKILAMHGHDDPLVPPEDVSKFQTEMTQAKADWQFITYGNAVHAFTNKLANDPNFGTVYNKIADKRSWQACRDFLDEVFSAS